MTTEFLDKVSSELRRAGLVGNHHVFVDRYTNPAAGWDAAKKFAEGRVRFPIVAIRRDAWLFRAFFLLSKIDHTDPVVEEAYELSRSEHSGVLNAMLMAGVGKEVEKYVGYVSTALSVDREVIDAYEVLFFNVLDRPEAELYLSQIAYPQGRAVIEEEDYHTNSTVDELLLRAAYDHRDPEFVNYLAGIDPSEFLEALTSKGRAERELVARMTTAARIHADLGGLNSPSPAIDRVIKLRRMASDAKPPVTLPDDYEFGADLKRAMAEFHGFDKSDDLEHVTIEPTYPPPPNLKALRSQGTVELYQKPFVASLRGKGMTLPVILMGTLTPPGGTYLFISQAGKLFPQAEIILP